MATAESYRLRAPELQRSARELSYSLSLASNYQQMMQYCNFSAQYDVCTELLSCRLQPMCCLEVCTGL